MEKHTHTAWVVNDLMNGKVGTGNLLHYNYEDIYFNLPDQIKENLSQEEFYGEAEKLISAELKKGKQAQNPFLLHMGGIPGAGKTYNVERMNLKNIILIQFDDIMENLNLYKKAIEKTEKSNKGELDRIFAVWEMPARVIAWELVGRALKQGYPLAIDSAGHSTEQYNLLTNLQKQGTKIGMFYLDISIPDALQRAKNRMIKTGRAVPKGMIEERYQLLEVLKHKYQEVLDIFFYLKANNDENGQPVDPTLKEIYFHGKPRKEVETTNIVTLLKKTN